MKRCGYWACTEKHENHHKMQFDTLCPGICKGLSCDKKVIRFPYWREKPGVSKGYCGAISECGATLVGLNCLLEVYKKQKSRNDGECIELGEELILEAWESVLQYCPALYTTIGTGEIPDWSIIDDLLKKYPGPSKKR